MDIRNKGLERRLRTEGPILEAVLVARHVTKRATIGSQNMTQSDVTGSRGAL